METMATNYRQLILSDLEALPDEILPSIVQVVHHFRTAME